jgi:glyoxylase-like metal-dependent hydrolase (beta-lactamase superfamily II)
VPERGEPARMTDTARHAWAEPGIELVADGVYRIPLPLPGDGLRAVNVYAILHDASLTLIDAGWALTEAREELARALAELGCGLGDIAEFFVTHAHRDHYTMAIEVRRMVGSRVSLGERERENLLYMHRLRAGTVQPGYLARLRRGGALELDGKAAIGDPHGDVWDFPDTWLPDGATITLPDRRLDVIATPGHTDGHVVFRDAGANLLFAGDHVLPHITPSIGFQPAPYPGPLSDYLRSLRLMLELPDTRLLPAHGPVRDSVHERVDELLAHHEQRLAEALAALTEPATALGVARAIPWTRSRRRFAELSIFDQVLAVNEAGAHLDVLTIRDLATQDEREDGAILYKRR